MEEARQAVRERVRSDLVAEQPLGRAEAEVEQPEVERRDGDRERGVQVEGRAAGAVERVPAAHALDPRRQETPEQEARDVPERGVGQASKSPSPAPLRCSERVVKKARAAAPERSRPGAGCQASEPRRTRRL